MKDSEGNVCLIESDEVRPEFREVFTSADVGNYLSAVFGESFNIEVSKENFHLNFPYPTNAESFWMLVELGKRVAS